MKTIHYGSPNIKIEDFDFLKKLVKSNFITQGKFVTEFENKLSKYLKCKYAASCNSGTSAIHMAFDALNINSKSIIIMPVINFISSYRIAKLMGAKVFLADVDCKTGQMTPKNIENCIRRHKLKKIDLLVTMYLGGDPINCVNFFQFKKKYGFKIMEDACHAFGAEYKHKNKFIKIGSCSHSDIAVFSFHAIKTITTGEGGALTTNNKKYYEKAKLFRTHGIVKKKLYWKYSIQNFGMNYRLSDINCGLGISQLKRVNQLITRRKMIYEYYSKNIEFLKEYCEISHISRETKSANHLMILIFKFEKMKISKNSIFNFFKQNKIYLQYHYQQIHKYKIFSDKKLQLYPGAYKFNDSAISFPIHPNLKINDLNKIFVVLKKMIKKFK